MCQHKLCQELIKDYGLIIHILLRDTKDKTRFIVNYDITCENKCELFKVVAPYPLTKDYCYYPDICDIIINKMKLADALKYAHCASDDEFIDKIFNLSDKYNCIKICDKNFVLIADAVLTFILTERKKTQKIYNYDELYEYRKEMGENDIINLISKRFGEIRSIIANNYKAQIISYALKY